jgi:hypothetical protein
MSKLQIIETSDYVLAVSDEEIKEGDWFYNPFINQIQIHCNSDRCRKIIAYLPKGNAPELDLPLLPEMVEDDVEKLAKGYFDAYSEGEHKEGLLMGFYHGHKAATKVYSEDNLREAIKMARVKDTNPKSTNAFLSFEDDIIQSLKQQSKWFVAETKYDTLMDNNSWWEGNLIVKLKTTTINGKTYLVGTYKFQ